MKHFFLLTLLMLPFLGQAQSKATMPVTLWPELQVNAGTGKDGFLFFRNQYHINTDSRYNDLKETGVLSGFERVEFNMGYEHVLSEHWRGGVILTYAAEDYPTTMYYGAFVRHSGTFKSLYFNKQLLFEYVDQEGRDKFGNNRVMTELGKRFPVNQKFITPSISYEALLITEFGKAEDDNEQQRTIDRTRLRLSFNYELTEKLRINPYFMRQTDYYYWEVPPVYDENEQLVEEGYTEKRNRITPIIGLEIKYTINRASTTASITY